MNSNLFNAAQAAIACDVHNYRGFRAIAATVMARYAQDLVAGWHPDGESERHMHRICKRFRVGDAFAAMHAGYLADKHQSAH